MKEIFANPTILLSFGMSFAVLIGSVGYCYEKFTAGRKKVKGEASDQTVENTRLIENLQKQLTAMDEVMTRKEKEHNEERSTWHREMGEMKGEIGRLQGTIAEKEKRLEDYERIFQNRNPKIEDSLAMIATFMGELSPMMEKIGTHFDKEHPMMK